MAKIRIDGTWFDWNEETISNQTVRNFMRTRGYNNYDQSRDFFYTSQKMRTANRVPDEEVPLDPQAVVQLTSFPGNAVYGTGVDDLQDIQDFKKLNQREKFILSQVFQVSERYFSKNQNAVLLSRDCDFVIIKDFPLPPTGDWMGRNTTICIYFPATYPKNAPVGFFVEERLQHRGRGENHLYRGTGIYTEPNAFYQKHGLKEKGYAFFCWHPEKNWRPNLDNPFKPDNLDSYLKMANMAFDSAATTGRRRVKEIK